MIIHVVKTGENIFSIADQYGVKASKLIQDNGLNNPYNLVPGQTIVIVTPQQEYVVREGDSLGSIANTHGVSLMQLLRNNPYLSTRDYIYPGETLTISYNTVRQAVTNGFAYPYIDTGVIRKTLPFLTYLSVFNYTATEEGNIIAYEDDTEIIQLAKDYGTIPLMMVTTLTTRGEPNIQVAFDILINEEFQDRNIENMLNILRTKGYLGVNIVFNYMNISNQNLYFRLINKISERMKKEGFLFFITINPSFRINNNVLEFDRIDLSGIDKYVDGIILMHFVWGSNNEAPGPVSSNYYLTEYVKFIVNSVPAHIIAIGIPIIGYEWQLPFTSGVSSANSLTIDSCLSLARDVNAVIQFNEESQTPYFVYNQFAFGNPSNSIVWFVDARSINALVGMTNDFQLGGTGIWNIMIYNAQLWLVVNTQLDIIKLIPSRI